MSGQEDDHNQSSRLQISEWSRQMAVLASSVIDIM